MEFLPISWHNQLHGEDTGTDSRLGPLTLRSIPKLRSFVNDTLLDVLFYTSPLYCQTILNTVAGEINRLTNLYKSRNRSFTGGVALVGHSLGSLILFDLLAGQGDQEVSKASPKPVPKPRWETELGLEEVFSKLGLETHITPFTNAGVGLEELLESSESDLQESGMSLVEAKLLLDYLSNRRQAGSGFQEFQQSSVSTSVNYNVGPAGTEWAVFKN